MPSVWPGACSVWAHVERITGEDQVVLGVGAAKADATAKILSISSSGKCCMGSLAIEKQCLLPPPPSPSRARKATVDLVSARARRREASAISGTVLKQARSDDAD